MSVRLSLLALLSEQPRHGYELKSEFDTRTGGTWPLNIGQVYTTLERLERDHLVARGEPDADGRVPYALTDAGREEVASWFAQPVATSPPRNELAIKLALAVTMPDVDVRAVVQTQRRASVEALQRWTRTRRASDPADLPGLLVIESHIHTTEAEIRWLDHCESAVLRAARTTRPGHHEGA